MNEKENKINLYVDDLRDCPNGFIVARTIEEAIDYLKKYNVDILSLDHDMGEDGQGRLRKNGYDLVKCFCENGLRANRIYLHTDNVVGRENMYQTLISARRRGFIDSDIQIFHYPITDNKYTI
jgi:hypothetical protein